MGARDCGLWSGVTGASAANKTISAARRLWPELFRSQAAWGSHGVPLGPWSSPRPAGGSHLQQGLELLCSHRQPAGGAQAAHSAWQGPVN